MVNKKHEIKDEDSEIEITNEILDLNEDIDDIVAEENQTDTIKALRTKLKTAENDKRSALEDLQRNKADFLNARRRLEEDRLRDRERSIFKHVEELIPLCDSFEMAMKDSVAWEKIDATWRKGIEGIAAQLQGLMTSYKVESINPLGQVFDPHKHEALSTMPTEDKSADGTVVALIQKGYQIRKADGQTELIRPARVVIGNFEQT